MSKSLAQKFLEESSARSSDSRQYRIIADNIDRYNRAFSEGSSKFLDLSNEKKRANSLKWKAIENLDRYLVEFETNFTKQGGKVIWANDATEARQEVWKIVEQQR